MLKALFVRAQLAFELEDDADVIVGRFADQPQCDAARKLLVALWKYVTAGVVIEGVTMKVA